MIDKVVFWAKDLDRHGRFLGKLIRLLYEICVCSPFQSAIHLVASCVLGAFCYKDGSINFQFVVPFGIIYLIAIIVFGICNQHRKQRNSLIKRYELSLPQISKSFQWECRKDVDLYTTLLSSKNFSQMMDCYSIHDVYTDTCFRVCAAIDELLQEISGFNSFRVITFLRTIGDEDEYYINGYSPQEPPPEAASCNDGKNKGKFDLNLYRAMYEKDKKSVPVHARPFLKRRIEPIIYLGNEVKKEYIDFNDEHPTKLHISIPCSISGNVVAVLQITSYDDCLGTRSSIKDLIENQLAIFTSYLKVVYMHQMEHELLASSLKQLKEIK